MGRGGVRHRLTLLLGAACADASNGVALTTESEDVMAPLLNMVLMPVLLLSDFMPFRCENA